MDRFLSIILLFTICYACKTKTEFPTSVLNTQGKIDRIVDFESKFISKRNVDVWLPADYNPNEKYAVLYLHDGQMLYDSTTTWNQQEWGVDEMMSELLQEKRITRTIVVGIWNTKDRHAEYFPQKPFESLPLSFQDSLMQQSKRKGKSALFSSAVNSDSYLKFLVQELKPYVDQHYSTLPDRDNTFVMGSSMGGLISLYALCEYPEVFGGAACLSTHWIGTFDVENNPVPNIFIEYLKKNLPNSLYHKIYFDFGTETLDALYEPFQIKVDAVLAEMGYDENNWVTFKFKGADHSERAWKSRLAIPLQFLLSNDKVRIYGQHFQMQNDVQSLKQVVEQINLNVDTSYLKSILGEPIDMGFDYRYLVDSVGPNGCVIGAVFHLNNRGEVDQKWMDEICE